MTISLNSEEERRHQERVKNHLAKMRKAYHHRLVLAALQALCALFLAWCAVDAYLSGAEWLQLSLACFSTLAVSSAALVTYITATKFLKLVDGWKTEA